MNSVNSYSTIKPQQQKAISHLLSSTDKGEIVKSVKPTSTITRSPESPSHMYSQPTSYTASQSRNLLSSIMTGNGNVTINVTPEIMGIRHGNLDESERGKKRTLDD